MDKKKEIPYVVPGRVGNFKIWRAKKSVGSGDTKSDLDIICISELDGGWQVRIPSTLEMYALLCEMYGSDDDEVLGALQYLIANMLYVSTIPNGFFSRAVGLCTMVYSNPHDFLNVKRGKAKKELKKIVKALVKDFCEWRKEVDERVKGYESSAEDMKHDEVAQEVIQSLSEAQDGK